VDGSAATDLESADVFQNGEIIARVPISDAGQPQSHTISARDAIGQRLTFAVRIATSGGRFSNTSNLGAIEPVAVPGAVQNLRAVVDQGRIRLAWDPPQENVNLAEVYLVQRADRTVGEFVMSPEFVDANYVSGEEYSYRVTAGRRAPGFIPGTGVESVVIEAVDRVPPASPAAVEATPSGNGSFLTWTPNGETDLAGYRISRGMRPDGDFAALHAGTHTANSFFDTAFHPGAYYVVTAVDDSGNESPPTVIQNRGQ
jgi:fibronectin type 3 domain-containing protein